MLESRKLHKGYRISGHVKLLYIYQGYSYIEWIKNFITYFIKFWAWTTEHL